MTLSIKDFTVTLDTELSEGDKLVLHLDRRDGAVPRLTLPFGGQQLSWAVQDPEYFEGGYRTWLATNVLDVLAEQGWTLGQVATALDVPVTVAMQIRADAAEKAAAKAAELAEVGA